MIVQDPLIGARFEKCVVERLIGRGGYGLTYLAFDEELQENRVIKVSQDTGLDEVARMRRLKTFLEEGLILSRLKHPQIVTLRGQGDKHGHRYMILDYIQGYSLKNVFDIVSQRQAELGCSWQDLLDPITATALVLSSLYPLEYAHRANVHLPDREIFGVAHRDISPGNLILGVKGNEKGRLILIDFGTAKTALTENVTVDQNLVGTIPYMSKARLQKANTPEQKAQYQDFWRDFRETQHDIHALGVLYYQLLTGRLPFHGETTPQIIVKILDPEAYVQCHLEIASAHGFASGVLGKCLVHQEFSLPLHEQPYQYPDAAAMRPEMEEVFHSLAGGRTVNEVLISLAKKLAHPETMLAASGGASSAGESEPESRMPTGGFAYALPYPPKRHSPWAIASAILAGLGLALAVAWWFGPRNALFDRAAWAGKDGSKALTDSSGANPASPGKNQGEELAGKTGILENLDGSGYVRKPGKGGRRYSRKKPTENPMPEDSVAGSLFPGGDTDSLEIQTLSDESPVAGEDSSTRVDSNLVWGKEAFVQVQTLVRQQNATAFWKISALLAEKPDSPDLGLLKCQLILSRNPTSAQARRDLAALQGSRPEFMHPLLFNEQAMYLLWKTDASIYESQKNPENRIRLLKSANAYLSEFGSQAAYRGKVKTIQDRIPK